MVPVARGMLDTSVFIARETGRPVKAELLPDQSVICPVTIAGAAGGRARRRRRRHPRATAGDARVDRGHRGPHDRCRGRRQWARLRVHLAETDRRLNVDDLWIAATAAAHGLPVVTQDDDFASLDGVEGFRVIRV